MLCAAVAAARINVVDEEDRRYFKQQEITLWRKVPAGLSAPVAQPTVYFEGERDVKAREEAEQAEAEVRKKNKKSKKSKKDKQVAPAAETTEQEKKTEADKTD